MVFRRHGRRHRGDSLLCTRCRPASCDVVEPTRWRSATSDPCGTAVGTPDGSEFLARGDPCGWIVFQAYHDPLLVFLRGVHGVGRTNPSPNNGRAWPLAMTRPPPSTSQLSPWQASPSGQQRDPEETASCPACTRTTRSRASPARLRPTGGIQRPRPRYGWREIRWSWSAPLTQSCLPRIILGALPHRRTESTPPTTHRASCRPTRRSPEEDVHAARTPPSHQLVRPAVPRSRKNSGQTPRSRARLRPIHGRRPRSRSPGARRDRPDRRGSGRRGDDRRRGIDRRGFRQRGGGARHHRRGGVRHQPRALGLAHERPRGDGPVGRGGHRRDALPRRLLRRHLPLEGPHRARRIRGTPHHFRRVHEQRPRLRLPADDHRQLRHRHTAGGRRLGPVRQRHPQLRGEVLGDWQRDLRQRPLRQRLGGRRPPGQKPP